MTNNNNNNINNKLFFKNQCTPGPFTRTFSLFLTDKFKYQTSPGTCKFIRRAYQKFGNLMYLSTLQKMFSLNDSQKQNENEDGDSQSKSQADLLNPSTGDRYVKSNLGSTVAFFNPSTIQDHFPSIDLRGSFGSIKSTRDSVRETEVSIVSEMERYGRLLQDDFDLQEFIDTKQLDEIERLEAYLSSPTRSSTADDADENLDMFAFTGLSAFLRGDALPLESHRTRTFSDAEAALRSISDYLDELDLWALQNVAQ